MNNKEKHMELLELIFHYVNSTEEKISSSKSSFRYEKLDKSNEKKEVRYQDLKAYRFEIVKPEMKIKFDISIFRKEGFFSDNHIIEILPRENRDWGSRHDVIIIDTHISGFPKKILRKIFDTLEKKESEFFLKQKESQLGGYIEEIQKGIDKSYSRDNKIENLLK